MRRRLPPIEQIEAFIEAARAPTFRVAAERCALSPAAFSRRIQQFAANLGVELFERDGIGLRLTEIGHRYLAELEPPYLELRRAAASVAESDDRREVILALSHSLAVCWVIPKLPAFKAAHPYLGLSFRTEHGASGMRGGEADLGIFSADTNLSGLRMQPLMPTLAVPVAAPEVRDQVIRHGGRLSGFTLLALTKPANTWDWWCDAVSWPERLGATLTFDILEAMYEAAAQGAGIALAATPTVGPYLRSGRLVRIEASAVRFGDGYHLAATIDRYRRPAVTKVWRWLLAEAASEMAEADAIAFIR